MSFCRPLVALAFLLASASASADEIASVATEASTTPRIHQERPFGFVIDPSSPRAGTTSVEYRVGFDSGLEADRPLPADLSSAGGSHNFTVSHGISDHFAPYVSATLFDQGRSANLLVGARFAIMAPSAPFRLTILAAGMRESAGDLGLQATAAASYDAGPLRIAANLQGEKIFATGRDALDTMAMAGASLRVLPFLRVGAEYVGQDLEGMFEEDEAEGGARHMVGPSAALDLEGGRYQLAVAGGFGLTSNSPSALVRAALAFNF
jgi:hypothetical protein